MAFDVYTTSATSTLTADEQSVAGECVPGYYSEPADFSVARNPAWNGLNATSSGQSDAYAKYTVTNLGTSTVYKRDTRYSIPYTDQSVMADAVRRIEIGRAHV